MARLTEEQKTTFLRRNYAHRGLHTPDRTVPENSPAAFQRARERGYGFELDVQLSADGRVVVFHDDTLDRVTEKAGRVDAFTWDELRRMSLCGTDQTIPLFSDVLKITEGGGPLIVELKNGPRNAELCRKTLDLLKDYKGTFCIESFNSFIVNWFHKNAPDVIRGQLSAPYAEMKKGTGNSLVAFLLSRCFFTFLNKPDFIAYQIGKRPKKVLRMRKNGVMLFAWTPHEAPDPLENDGVIFEFYEPELTY